MSYVFNYTIHLSLAYLCNFVYDSIVYSRPGKAIWPPWIWSQIIYGHHTASILPKIVQFYSIRNNRKICPISTATVRAPYDACLKSDGTGYFENSLTHQLFFYETNCYQPRSDMYLFRSTYRNKCLDTYCFHFSPEILETMYTKNTKNRVRTCGWITCNQPVPLQLLQYKRVHLHHFQSLA